VNPAVLSLAALPIAIALSAGTTFVARWGGHTKDLGYAVTTDASSLFVAGATWSADFPVSAGGSPDGETWCAFLTQLARSNGALVRSSVLCGRGMTYGHAAAADGRGAVWIGGTSSGPGLPISRDAAQSAYGGGSTMGTGDAFIARWSADGTVDYLTYLGGAGDDAVWGLASDGAGGVWAAGSTTSRPMVGGAGDRAPTGTIGTADGFIAHVAADRRVAAIKVIGDALLYDLALIDRDRLVVVGSTASRDGALGAPLGHTDGFVASIDRETLKVSWMLRLGSTGDDVLRAVTVVDGRTIVAAGDTDGGAGRPRRGDTDGWVATISPTGSLIRSACVGTAAADHVRDAAATPDGTVWVTGTTDAASPHGPTSRTAHDRAFAALVRPTGAVDSLRLLSDEISRGYGITADAQGNVYAVGETTAVPSKAGTWTPALHPTAGAFRGKHPPGSTDPYVIALRP
jgi:hypothetical protein